MTAAPSRCIRLASFIHLPYSRRKTSINLSGFAGGGGGTQLTRRPYTDIVAPCDRKDDAGVRQPEAIVVAAPAASGGRITPTNPNQRQLQLADHSLRHGHFKDRLRRTVDFEGGGVTAATSDADGRDGIGDESVKLPPPTSSSTSTSAATVILPLQHRCQPLTGVVCGQYRDTDHVEMLGLLGYDFLWADAEHSSAAPDDIARMILAAERRGLPTLVRVGSGYQDVLGHIQKYLVAGAQGILLPQCESGKDVEKLVGAVKFPPVGKRGLAGERWNAWGLAKQQRQEQPGRPPQSSEGADHAAPAPQVMHGQRVSLAQCVEDANRNSIVGVVVESRRGIDALEDILAVPELDFVFVAPTDLSSDMGLHGQIRHPDVLARIEFAGRIIHEANLTRHRAGNRDGTIAAGTLALTADDYIYWRQRNFQVLCGVAQSMFVDGARGFMDRIQDYEHSQGNRDCAK